MMHAQGLRFHVSGWRLAGALLLGAMVFAGILVLGTFLLVGAVVASLIASGVYALKRRFSTGKELGGYASKPVSSASLVTREIEITEILPRE
jgi:hypothetical protein